MTKVLLTNKPSTWGIRHSFKYLFVAKSIGMTNVFEFMSKQKLFLLDKAFLEILKNADVHESLGNPFRFNLFGFSEVPPKFIPTNVRIKDKCEPIRLREPITVSHDISVKGFCWNILSFMFENQACPLTDKDANLLEDAIFRKDKFVEVDLSSYGVNRMKKWSYTELCSNILIK